MDIPVTPIRRRVSIISICAGAALGVACAHEPPFQNPHARWQTVSSTHFRLQTDAPAHDYERILERLEDTYDALTSSFFPRTTIPVIEGLLFNDDQDFEDTLGPVGGVFVPRLGTAGGVLVIRNVEDYTWVEQTAAHELAHRFIAAKYPWVPMWFNEGFASYLETVQLEEKRLLFGTPPPSTVQAFLDGKLVPIEMMAGARREVFHGNWERSHYATAWALIHYLLNGDDQRRRMAALLKGFKDAATVPGKGGNGSADAIHAAFPEVTLAELDGRLRDHAFSIGNQNKRRLLVIGFQRQPREPLRLQPADRNYIRAICQELHKFKRPARM